MATNNVLSDVGATLEAIINSGVSTIVTPSNVMITTTDKLRDSPPVEPGVTIFLYQISSNAELRNNPPPPGFSRPKLALELRYLVTPWTNDADTVHQLCGHILQTLYDHTSLVRGDLHGSSWSADDTLQILLESLPVSEHHHIWDPANIPYKLSLAYLVRVTGLDPGTVDTPAIVTTVDMGGSQ